MNRQFEPDASANLLRLLQDPNRRTLAKRVASVVNRAAVRSSWRDDFTEGTLGPRRERPQRRHGLLPHWGDYEQGSDMETCAESVSSPQCHLLHSSTGVGLRLTGDPR